MSVVRKYRKKPVEIEAIELTGPNAMQRAVKWCGGRYYYEVKASDPSDVEHWVHIPTLEGLKTAFRGDFIVKGEEGEFYPCKPYNFAATYEEIE